jgi:hypothetical protein
VRLISEKNILNLLCALSDLGGKTPYPEPPRIWL